LRRRRSQMRYCLIPVVAAVLSLAPLRADEPSPADKLLQGVWRVKVSAEGDAESLFSGELQDAVFVFNKSELTVVTRQNKIYKGAFTAAPGKGEAFTLDFVWSEKKVQGLLAQKKSGVVLCFDKSGKERPASFQMDSERPTLALVQLEKLAPDKAANVLSEKETKWVRGFADDFMAALIKEEKRTFRPMLSAEDGLRFNRTILYDPNDFEYTRIGKEKYYVDYKTYSIDHGEISPSGEEAVFRGTFIGSAALGKEGEIKDKAAKYTLRIKKEEKSGRWAVVAYDFAWVPEKKDK
jgi:hypothetical protein